MTRDERRHACLEAMARARFAYHIRVSGVITEDAFTWDSLPDSVKQKYLDLEAVVLDSIPLASARVVPVEATEEMVNATEVHWDIRLPRYLLLNVANAAGDLTNPPEDDLDIRPHPAFRGTNPPEKKL